MDVIQRLDEFSFEYLGARLAEEITPGDHIYILLTDPLIYEHHGIYLGGNKVMHF